MLSCSPCLDESFTTRGPGTRDAASCHAIPQNHRTPTFPLDTPVTVRFDWTKYLEPDQDTRTIDMYLSLQFKWRDDRVALHSYLGQRLGAAISESEWRALGMWLPAFTLSDADANTTVDSTITTTAAPLGYGNTQVTCTWNFNLEPVTIKWYVDTGKYKLDWALFPFGEQHLRLQLQCLSGAACSPDASDGSFSSNATTPENATVIEDVDDATGTTRRRVLRVGSAAIAGSALGSSASGSSDGLPLQFPYVNDVKELVEGTSGYPKFTITLTMRRVASLYIVRLCVPLVLVLVLALYFFYVNESYNQLDLSFNSLLVIALIAIEVKDFMPNHVISITWIDWFVTINIVLIVFATILSLIIIVLEEHPSPLMNVCSVCMDNTVKRTQWIAAAIINGTLLILGYVNVDSDTIRLFAILSVVVDVILFSVIFAVSARYAMRKEKRKMLEEKADYNPSEIEQRDAETVPMAVAALESMSGLVEPESKADYQAGLANGVANGDESPSASGRVIGSSGRVKVRRRASSRKPHVESAAEDTGRPYSHNDRSFEFVTTSHDDPNHRV